MTGHTAPEGAAETERADALPLVVDALLLDLDGTLIDSGPAVIRSWNRVLAELGTGRTFSDEFHGIPARATLRSILPDASEEEVDDAFRRVEDAEAADVEDIAVLPGTARVLAELDAAAEELGRPTWAIVTSCTRRLFGARWGATGLPEPEVLVTADRVSAGKPDPEPFALGAELLGVAPGAALAIEDSAGGLRSARDAGARTLAVTTTTSAADLRPLAEALVTSLDDIEVTVADGRLVVDRRGR